MPLFAQLSDFFFQKRPFVGGHTGQDGDQTPAEIGMTGENVAHEPSDFLVFVRLHKHAAFAGAQPVLVYVELTAHSKTKLVCYAVYTTFNLADRIFF